MAGVQLFATRGHSCFYRLTLVGLGLASAPGTTVHRNAPAQPVVLFDVGPAKPLASEPPVVATPPSPEFAWDAALCPSEGTEPLAVLVTPRVPSNSRPTRVLVVLDDGELRFAEARFSYVDGTSTVVTASPIEVRDADTRSVEFVERRGSDLASVKIRVGEQVVACRVKATFRGAPRRAWDAHAERLFSLWIARLFSFEERELLSSSLDLVRREELNFLHSHLGLGEDDPTSPLTFAPDCADFPLALRLYFAWKLGLPFGFARSWHPSDERLPSRLGVSATRPSDESPSDERLSDESPSDESADEVPPRVFFDVIIDGKSVVRVRDFVEGLKRLSDRVSAGVLRQQGGSEQSLLYPVALSRGSLRPGTPFIDAFSHVSIIVAWAPSTNGGRRLIVADAQPSGMVSLHRYVEGRLVYRAGRGGVGFQWYRPTARLPNETYTPTSNAGLSRRPDAYLRPAPGEAQRTEAAFAETLDTLEDPQPREPVARYLELHEALLEALQSREQIVKEGFKRRLAMPSDTPVPASARMLFHGVGVWEADATPCRDLRLLGYLRNVSSFPQAVESNPARYERPPGETSAALRSRLEALGARWLDELGVTYTRSDGTPFRLSLREVYARRRKFEMAYNPNDCPEVRWGAPAGSEEQRPCTQRAPAVQRHTMAGYRSWFQEGYGCE